MYVPEQKFGSRAEQVDFAGLLLLTISIGCLQTMLERGGKLDWWASREIVLYAVSSASAMVLFVWNELRHPHPIVDLRILKNGQFTVSLVFGFVVGAALFSVVFVFPVYAQTLIGFTAWETGMAVLPGAIASGVTMAFMGKLMPRMTIDLRLLVVAGALIFAYSMWSHSLFTTQSGADDFFWPMVLRGVGLGMVFIPLNNLALGNLPPEQIAPASGMYNLLRQLGGSVGIASSATLFSEFQEGNRGQLLHHLSQFTDAATHRLAQLEQLMRLHGNSEAVAHQKALMLLDGMLGKQAAMLAFERLFLAFGVMMLAALPLLLLMQRSRFSRQGPAADH
jgi:DHA2 family multidrug resistance protein